MSEHPNIALVRRTFEAFAKGDLPAIRELWADDGVWHSTGRNWLVGDYRGIDNILQFLGTVGAYSGGSYASEVHDILANDRRVVALLRLTASRTDGRSMSVDSTIVFDILDGKIVEAWACPWDIYEEDHYYGLTPPPGMAAPEKLASPGCYFWHDGRR